MFNYILNIHIMNIRKIGKILILVSVTLATLGSCVMDRKISFYIRNCTNETLLIELTESDTLDDEICWGKHSGDTIELDPEDTIGIYVHGKKVFFKNCFYALPDSVLFVSPYIFNLKDTCYIYAIKWEMARHYTIEEIRAKKLYDRRPVTKRDFHNRLFEYRPAESARNY